MYFSTGAQARTGCHQGVECGCYFFEGAGACHMIILCSGAGRCTPTMGEQFLALLRGLRENVGGNSVRPRLIRGTQLQKG